MASETASLKDAECACLDPAEVRGDFPALSRRVGDYPLAYLDNTAATLKPRAVIDAVADFYAQRPANVHRGIHLLSEEATDHYERARATIARFINAAKPEELVFTRNTTESINMVAYCWAMRQLKPGDEILCTVMEHHANLIPWQIVAEQTGCTLHFARVLGSGQLDLEDWHAKLSERTKLVAVTHVSNVLGVINPVKELCAAAHRVGALALVDGAQSVPHHRVDVQDIGCDFLSFSGYKILGPFGIGALWGRYELLDAMPPYQTGGSMIHTVTLEKTTFAEPPQRFEAGTPAIADAIGFAAAIDYINHIGLDRILKREVELSRYMHQRLAEVPGLRVAGDWFAGKPGIASFILDCAHPHDVAQFLTEEGVAVRAGHHCAEPLHTALGIDSTTRASVYLYNTEAEVDQLIAALGTVREIFG
jgi:cysteine desulfurase / selenocysteine lyase